MTTDKEQIIANWDFSAIPSPCYVLHTDLLQANLQTIDKVRKATKAEYIKALEYEFTLPLPNNRRWNLDKEIIPIFEKI